MTDKDIIFETVDLKISAVRDDGSELPIVKGVDIAVPRGNVVALIGESGSGKTGAGVTAHPVASMGANDASNNACLSERHFFLP